MVDILGSRPLLVSVSFIIMEDQVADDDSLERQAKKIAILEKNFPNRNILSCQLIDMNIKTF